MGRKTWSDEEKKLLVELYPLHTDAELCEILDKRITQIRGMKERLGLRAKRKPKINRVGEKYGLLTVVGEAEKTPGSSNTRWSCRCEKCGCIVTVTDYWLRNSNPYGHCECTKFDPEYAVFKRGVENPSYKHGGTGTKLYKIWCAMHSRTTNPNQWNYQYYGGRGISICDEWKAFPVFQEWAINNGYIDGLSIDRIDPNKNYEPNNCRWIPLNEQQANRRPFNLHKAVIADMKG